MKSFLARAVLLASVAVAGADEAADYRLPAGVTPTSQAIELRVDPGREDFSGRVEISLRIATEVSRIGVYAVGLDLDSIVLSAKGNSRPLEADEGDYEMIWLADGLPIASGDYTLAIDFRGRFSTDALGMHRVTFEGNDYVFTQMEMMYARRAMPLFDEPGFKIPYELTIIAPEGQTVIANTPVDRRQTEDDWQRVQFMRTKPMPSYLLAWAVGPLDRIPIRGLPVPGYIYTPAGHVDEAGFYLREAPRIFAALEDYFGIDYPYRKLDFVAVPEFAFGAMENPGLVTFRTDLILIGDEPVGLTAARALSVIAHEIGHMWFGNLVTPAWWDDLWLNEAFASWIAASITGRLYPQYETDLYLPKTRALAADQRTTVRPIRRTVRTEGDIMADVGLQYTKGATLLGMLEQYVGTDAWQEGMQLYMERFAWRNASAADLWATMSGATGEDIGAIVTGYLEQPGYPILEFDVDGRVSQRRFVPWGLTAEPLQWQIPLTIRYRHDGRVRKTFYLLDGETGRIDVPADADWIFPDVDANGYFRWQIDEQQFRALVGDMESLTNREKIAFLDNAEALFKATRLTLDQYLSVVAVQLEDDHPLVVLPAVEKLIDIGNEFVDAGNASAFGRFVDAKLSARLERIGARARPGDSQALMRLRPRLLRVLGQYGAGPTARDVAAELAMEYLDDPAAVTPDVAREALRVTALADDGSLYDDYIKAYLASDSEQQKSVILSAIYFNDDSVIRRHLDFSISPAVQAGDVATGLGLYVTVVDDHAIFYDWLAENLAAFEARIPAWRRPSLPTIMLGVCRPENLQLMKDFFAEKDPKYRENLAKVVETLETCIDRKRREGAALTAWLEAREEAGFSAD